MGTQDMSIQWKQLLEALSNRTVTCGTPEQSAEAKITIEPGLSDNELKKVEDTFEFRFPDDLRLMLQTGLPTGPRFPHWRNFNQAHMKQWIDWGRADLIFDVEDFLLDFKLDGTWIDNWGPKPNSESVATKLVHQAIDSASKMIPVFSHRMIPATPCETGNPIFSIYDQDIIYYGRNLASYFCGEFGIKGIEIPKDKFKYIPFWSDVVER